MKIKLSRIRQNKTDRFYVKVGLFYIKDPRFITTNIHEGKEKYTFIKEIATKQEKCPYEIGKIRGEYEEYIFDECEVNLGDNLYSTIKAKHKIVAKK
jgi:hypothetical protein